MTLNIALCGEAPDEEYFNAVLRQLTQGKAEFWMPASMMNRAILYSRWRKRQRARRTAGWQKAGSYFEATNCRAIRGGIYGLPASDAGYPRWPPKQKRVDNTTSILRLMLLLSLAIGVVLRRALQGKRTPLAVALPCNGQQAWCSGRGRA